MATQKEFADQKKELDKHTPVLIEKTDAFVTLIKHRKDWEKPKGTQFTGLVEAGQQASCVEELQLFIKYKEAKQGTSKQWRGLAVPLVKLIDDVCALVAPELRLALVQRFLGYLMWNAHANGGVK